MRVKELFTWMRERHSIYLKRLAGNSKPWTTDPILQQYRFCNVYRELDAVTQWIASNWRTPHAADKHLWFAMVVARLFNLPDTLAQIGYPLERQFDKWCTHVRDVVTTRKKDGANVFNSAYIVSTNGRAMDKVDYLLAEVLTPLWNDRKIISGNALALIERSLPMAGCLQNIHSGLTEYNGLGSFMAAQVVADLKYVAPLTQARDWHTWAASGPGSRRGLNRVYDRDVNASWTEAAWLEMLRNLHGYINIQVKRYKMPPVHAQDLQNCLCEFDKYERTRLGEGRPRNKYEGV